MLPSQSAAADAARVAPLEPPSPSAAWTGAMLRIVIALALPVACEDDEKGLIRWSGGRSGGFRERKWERMSGCLGKWKIEKRW